MDSPRHPDLDRLAQADRPAFLFTADGLVWCNAAAAAFWGAPSRAGMLTNDARLAAARAQAADILRNLPAGTTRLERMKIVPFGRTVPLTAQVQRLALPEGGRALLVTGMEAVARHAVAAVLAREAPPAPTHEPIAEPAAEPVVAAVEDTGPTETPAAESPPIAEAAPEPESQPEPAPAAPELVAPAPIAPVKPMRFAWQTDAAGVLARVSDAFAAAVGADSLPQAPETLAQFGARAGWDAEIVDALRAADTLTTRAVRWPLAGSDEAVTVELSATPVPGGGLRGLGIVTGRAAPLPVVASSEAEAASASHEPTADEPAVPEPAPEPEPEPDLDAAAEADAPEVDDLPEADDAPAETAPVTGEPVTSAANVLAFPSQKLASAAPERRLDATDQAALRTIARVLGGPIAVPQPSHAEESNASFTEAPQRQPAESSVTVGGPGEAGSAPPPSTPVRPPPLEASVTPSAFFVPETPEAAATAPPPDADPSPALAEELAAAERRVRELTAILDTATDGVVVLDDRYRIVSLNRAAQALFGVENEAMAGLPFTHVLAPESHREVTGYIDGLMQNGVVTLLNDGRDVTGVEKNGGRIPLFMTVGRLGDHEPGRFCAVLRDVTQWKRAEQDLIDARRAAEQANNQKSDFLAKISHEIRTPLNAIIGFSEVMIEERFGRIESERYRGYLADIRSSGEHLLSLVNDLLDLSKIEAGKLELSFSAVRLGDLVQQAVATMQPQANREGVILRTSLPRTPPVVADPRSLRQILFNLLSNAIKFTKSGGQVIVSTAMTDTGEVSLRVRDTGVGMSDKDVRTALEPFRQIATKGRAQAQGTGLGLPLTKALAEANRAAFSIESAPAEGTLVQITFPSTRVLAE